MRADHAIRHNAAVGALAGLAVADALPARPPLPPRICGGAFEPLEWGVVAARCFAVAEQTVRREMLDMGLGATDIVGAAIALADPDTSPPLLVDGDAVLVCSLVRAGLVGKLDLAGVAGAGPGTATAMQIVATADDYCEAVSAADPAKRALVGALAGLRWGPAAIPAAWITGVHGLVGERTYGLRQLRRLAERLMGQDAPIPPEPRRSLGPRQVAPKLWLSNLHAVPRFVDAHPEGAVISLCPTTGAFDHHPTRREFALHDAGGSRVNPRLSATVDEVLATIATFHAEDRDVLVHCHHGASRTGLILRAWLIEELGLSDEDATAEAQARWQKTSTWNAAFAAEIRRRAGG